MILLGIDPGLASTGYGVAEETGRELMALAWGVIATPKGQPQAARLKDIYDSTGDLIETWNPAIIVIERMIFTQARAHAQQTSEARGAVLAAAAEAGVPVAEYTPQQAKESATGYGRAEKREVQEAVQVQFEMATLPRPDHAADALAQILAHIQRRTS